MAIDTIEDALTNMGQMLPSIAPAARKALEDGGSYEVVITITQDKHGSTVAMTGRDASARHRYGRLIRLK